MSILVVAVSSLAGCKTSGYDRADAAVSSLNDLSTEGIRGQQQINKTIASLERIQATADSDPRPAFDAFKSDLATLQSIAATARSRGNSLRERAKAHYTAWEAELRQISSDELRARGEERLAKARARFEELSKKWQEAGEAYNPFETDLKDLRIALEHDLNPSGIKSHGDLIKKAKKDGDTVIERIDKALVVTREIRQEMEAQRSAAPSTTK